MRTGWVVAGVMLVAAVATTSGATEPGFATTRIPHRDGSGRGTVVEIQPSVPGARDFVREEEHPAPRRGEVSLPSATPVATSTPQPSPATCPDAATRRPRS